MNFKEFANQKTLYIMRGISGSGKSTLAKHMQQKEGGVIYGSDEFRYKNGVYVFDAETDGQNHVKNIVRAKEAIKAGVSPIFIDNTNVKYQHAKPYIDEALKHGYEVKVIEPNTAWAFDAEELSKRNSGRAPLSVIHQMISDWEPHEVFVGKIRNEL